MTAPEKTEAYRRDLGYSLTATFRPGSRVHGWRLEKIQEAMEQAFAEEMSKQLPNAIADVHSSLEWRYVFRDSSRDAKVGGEQPEAESESNYTAEPPEDSDEE